MSWQEFAVFDTVFGVCGIAWNQIGIVGVQLPERHARATRARLQRRYPEARQSVPPTHVQYVIEAIGALLRGVKSEFSTVVLDMDGVPELHQRVYDIARTIPAGATLSYGEIAIRLGNRSMARDVGVALGANPFPIIVPCHRVLAAGGKLGGFSAAGGAMTKLRLLEIEGAEIGERPTLFEYLPLDVCQRRR